MVKRRLVAFINSYSQGMSGGDACFIEIAKRIKDFQKIVVTSQMGQEICRARGLEADFRTTTKETIFKNVAWIYLKRILKVFGLGLKVGKEDVVYSTSDFLPDVLPAFLFKIRLKKKVLWVQRIFHLIPKARKVSCFAQKFSFFLIKKLADLIIVDNQLLKEELISLGFKKEKIEVNYPGIDLAHFQNIDCTPGLKYDAVSLSRLHPSKGIFELVEIWKLVCKDRPGYKLAMIGGGSEKVKQDLKNHIQKLGLQNCIDVLGYLDDSEVHKILKSSKIFVLASREEGFGIVILEAMACGLPAVAWDLPVFREVFPKGMLRVLMGDQENFSGAILSLLNDSSLHEKIAKETSNISKKYDWDEIAEREFNLISSAFQKKEIFV